MEPHILREVGGGCKDDRQMVSSRTPSLQCVLVLVPHHQIIEISCFLKSFLQRKYISD